MGFCITNRWGAMEEDPPIERLRELLESLEIEDTEHPDIALTHETGRCLSAFPSGLLVWENEEADAPRHMKGVPREACLCPMAQTG
jgi:hypothetical protein